MFLTIRKILILFSLAGLSFGLLACAEEEQNRLLRYEKGTYLGKVDQQLSEDQLRQLISLEWSTYILVFALFKVGRLGNMFPKIFECFSHIVALLFGSFSTLAPAIAQTKGEVPGAALGIKSDSDLWRYVRTGHAGTSQMKTSWLV